MNRDRSRRNIAHPVSRHPHTSAHRRAPEPEVAPPEARPGPAGSPLPPKPDSDSHERVSSGQGIVT
ncbi:MAG: hypothetical protein ACYDHX_09665 [Methanothrix sp.]